jgi:hypothetical protein
LPHEVILDAAYGLASGWSFAIATLPALAPAIGIVMITVGDTEDDTIEAP